jgi:hypothetical protein
MTTKASKNSRAIRAASKQKTARKTTKKANQKKSDAKVASDRFVKDVVVRGEAKELDEKGKLPSDATHVVTKSEKDGSLTIRRARFKLY